MSTTVYRPIKHKLFYINDKTYISRSHYEIKIIQRCLPQLFTSGLTFIIKN